MADSSQGARPLSPHLTAYRLPLNAVLSILHRATGCALAGAGALVVWWLFAAATGPEYFAVADAFLTSWFGLLILFGATWALAHHFIHGIHHLIWDMGFGYGAEEVALGGKITVAGAAALTALIWILF